MPEARATLRYSGTAPSKVREVLALVRGLDVETARRTLRFSQRAAAVEIIKVLDSAIANAEHNAGIPSDELFVSRAYADEGPTLRRFRPRARGRATRIRKRSSHVTIIVARYSDDELQRRRRREAADGAAGRRRRPARRRPAARADRGAPAEVHDHDHDEGPGEGPDHGVEAVAAGAEVEEVATAAEPGADETVTGAADTESGTDTDSAADTDADGGAGEAGDGDAAEEAGPDDDGADDDDRERAE